MQTEKLSKSNLVHRGFTEMIVGGCDVQLEYLDSRIRVIA